MPKDRHYRRTYAGHKARRYPLYPGLLASPPARNAFLLKLFVRLLAVVLVAILGLVSFVGFGLYSAYAQTTATLKPRLAAINNRELFETSRMVDRNGKLLYEFFNAGKRTSVPIEQISPLLIKATIAIEDQTFYTNQGIDLAGIVRTLLSSLEAGEETGGASTITQQVIKRIVLTEEERAPDKRYERKLKEIVLAQELDKILSKDDILSLYLNEIFYGNLAYGIEAASNVYFDRSARDLTLAQAALLAGLPQLPSLYNPINHLERDEQGGYLPGLRLSNGWLEPTYQLPGDLPPPKWRQISVLRRMVAEGYVTESQARVAITEDLRFAPQEVPLNAPHFVFYVRDQLQELYGQDVFNRGLTITTTIDLELQAMVQQKAAERIAELEARNIHNAAVVVMQPNTGQILSMVGSIDYGKVVPTKTPGQSGNVLDGQVNVTTRERQPGSALKPFTYLAAMEKGLTPASILWDVPSEFPTGTGDWYAPLNYNGRFNGPVRIRQALANSLNLPAVKALKFAGIDYTLSLLDRVGIKNGLKRGKDFYGLSLTLGGGEVTPLELTTAYNTLASGGKYHAPVAILGISAANGEPLELKQDPPTQVVDPGLAAIITDMMSDDRARQAVWGLNSPLKLSIPAAVKTGTTNDWRDAWAAGYTSFVTVGVWTGNNNNEETAKVESLSGGGIIWRNVMEEIFVWIDQQPRYKALFGGPFGGTPPKTFAMPREAALARAGMCELPGSYGGYNEELFTNTMLTRTLTQSLSLQFATARPAAPATENSMPVGVALGRDGKPVSFTCDAFRRVTVVLIPNAGGAIPIASTDAQTQTLSLSGRYCRPVEGVNYPSELVRTLYIWNTPQPDKDEKVRYEWSWGRAQPVDGEEGDSDLPQNIDSGSYGNFPPCTQTMFIPPTPTPEPVPVAGAVRMPDLYRLGENQAKEVLARLGFSGPIIYVDYQGRDKIGALFDQLPPYSVVSTLPAPGDWILPGTTIVLGIRAPDDTPAAPTAIVQPPAEQPQPTPTAVPESGPPPTQVPPPEDPGGRPAPLPTGLPLP
jgi:membrane peptidoglycan carboxypeptidase